MEKSVIGLQRGTVKIVPYNPAWTQQFEQEKETLKNLFEDRIIAIEHVGSTAIPGLPAKPIIDIDIAVRSLTDVQDFIEKLPTLGYMYLPERSYPVPEYAYRQFFVKGPESSRTHHLKLIELQSKEWQDPILFRDYLRVHSSTRNEYATLKERLAERYTDDRQAYTESKAKFIEEVTNRARRATQQ